MSDKKGIMGLGGLYDNQLHIVIKPVLCGTAGYFHSLVVWPNSLVKRYEKTRKISQPYHTLSAIRHVNQRLIGCHARRPRDRSWGEWATGAREERTAEGEGAGRKAGGFPSMLRDQNAARTTGAPVWSVRRSRLDARGVSC